MEFKTGLTVMTVGVREKVEKSVEFAKFITNSLKRYSVCDWGEMSNEDKELNDSAVKNGDDRIFAAYETTIDSKPEKVWIITEWDRSATTILLPCEY